MFNKNRGQNLVSRSETRLDPVAPSSRNSPLEGVSGDGVVLIGRGTRITGEIKDATLLEVQGDFDGTVSASAVIIRDGASFKGSLHAEYVEVHGLVEGALVAQKLLDIRSTGIVTAEVRYGQLSVATGGQISGDVQTQTIEGSVLRDEPRMPPAPHLVELNGSSQHN